MSTTPLNKAFLTKWYSDCRDPTATNETIGCWGEFQQVNISLDFTGSTCYVNPYLKNHMFWFEDCSKPTNTTSPDCVKGWMLQSTAVYVSSAEDDKVTVPYDMLSASDCTAEGVCGCDSIVLPDKNNSVVYSEMRKYNFYQPEENLLISTECGNDSVITTPTGQKPMCDILGSIEADAVPALSPAETKMPTATSGAPHGLFPMFPIYSAAIWGFPMVVGHIF